MNKFYIKIAGLTVEMNARSEFAYEFCRDFETKEPSGNADIIATTTREDVLKEMEASPEVNDEEYVEILCLYRQIAQRLPEFNRFVFHGASISLNDKEGYLFTAPSGTGKSTHIKLWREHIGAAVNIINGDKPIIHISDDGITVCSTPWAGKENWRRPIDLPLNGICVITRGEKNTVRRLTPSEALKIFMHQVYLPKTSGSLGLTLELLDKLLTRVPIHLLACDISREAVEISYNALTGKTF